LIHRILVPLDFSSYTKTAIECACGIALAHESNVVGLAMLDFPGIERSTGPVPLGALSYASHLEQHRMEEARKIISQLLTSFDEACAKSGVKYRHSEIQGNPPDSLIENAIYYDLVVMGMRTFFKYGTTEDSPGDTFEQLLDHSVTPILAVPESLSSNILSGRVLVLFDGGPSASRALQCFTRMAARGHASYEKVVLLYAGEDKEAAEYLLSQADGYLTDCGVGDVKREWTSLPLIEVLNDRYLAETDLVVVGAHSRRKIVDFFVGSVCKHLIKTAEKPLLIGL
jgi:nucleotide-binding universal stress UspA family protein